MTDYLGDLVRVLRSPEWLANTGLPLGFTLGGLGVAYYFLRRQLHSDRELRRADHRRDAGTRLGSELLRAARQLKELAHTDPELRSSTWEDRSPVARAVDDAAIELPAEALQGLQHLVDSTGDAWMACIIGARGRRPDIGHHATAMRRAMDPHADALASAGATLRAWDGEGSPHRDGAVVGSADAGLLAPSRREHAQWTAWMTEVKARYEAELDRVEGKGGLSLQKKVGESLFGDPARSPSGG